MCIYGTVLKQQKHKHTQPQHNVEKSTLKKIKN